ncbi:MAG TPA: hypothetical protein VGQ42_09895 [Candidatus Dormibacteraeota bacterium]|nr:hypothetical protein [Candidatus Dormibacteraeota bacterium]
MSVRRLVVVAGAVGAITLGGLAVPRPAVAATGGGLCQLAGTATFAPGLSTTAQSFSYSFGGALSGCQSSDSTAPTSGTVEAGKTVTVSYSWSYVDTAGVTHTGTSSAVYQEPVPTGSGSCGSSTTSGTSIANWADGTATVVSYTTTGVAAGVSLSGSVVPSTTLTLAGYTGPTQAPPPSTRTVSTTRNAGDSALGTLTFQPPDPTLCASTGVTTAAISGSIGLGSPS